MYPYVKALHIIFVVTWFSGMFYIVRLFIYNTEANDLREPERQILQKQFRLMIKRLWLGITWPSALLTLMMGLWLLLLYGFVPQWLWVKFAFVLGLYAYHFSLHFIYVLQMRNIFSFSSMQLRIWNEVATIFLIAIIMIAVVKNSMSWIWGLFGLLLLMVLLFSAIKLYRIIRDKK